jgi:ubiquinone/menaquinone biosynthesis C-methylase UbiE
MGFDQVRRDWTTLGDEDPLWAVSVADGKRGNRWDVEEFLATGGADVAAARDWLRELGLPTEWERVLDFGCGAGRLSQALAVHADEVVGVDVSAPMLRTAERLDRSSGRCRFVLNEAPDLHVFPSAAFDLVFSELVLQHLPAKLVAEYLAEFVRVLRPGATAVFQCTTRPMWTMKGMLWRFAPHPLIRLGQKLALGYPAPMRMTPVSETAVAALVTAAGGSVVATRTAPEPETHWVSTRYVVRKNG